MPLVKRCNRCGKPIPGIPVVVGDRYFGKGCYEVYYRRMKLRASALISCSEYTESTCLDCPFLKQAKCPLEQNNNLTIGRKR